MRIKIFGAESLGVRGLSCSVSLKDRKIFIDPGLALGWSRHGFLPHPFQVAVGARIRSEIISELQSTDDIVISHFHGDHCPLLQPNPYQLGIQEVKKSFTDCRIWTKDTEKASPRQQKRKADLSAILAKDLPSAEGAKNGALEFSIPVHHGQQRGKSNMVMMTKIEEDGFVFVHASDIQLLDAKTIELILEWEPDTVLTSGPPLYHYSSSAFDRQRETAWQNALKLTNHIDTLILDHHLLRSVEGAEWLEALKGRSSGSVMCAAEYMGRPILLLEAWRKELYDWLPVPAEWHQAYAVGAVDAVSYLSSGWEALYTHGKIGSPPPSMLP